MGETLVSQAAELPAGCSDRCNSGSSARSAERARVPAAGLGSCALLSVAAFGCCRMRPPSFNGGSNSSAWAEDSAHHCPFGISGAYYIVQNSVDDVFLKDAEIAVAGQIFFQRLQLQAAFARHVAQCEHAEIGESGFRTDGCEFRNINLDFVSRELVRPGLDFREIEIESRLCVLGSVSGAFWHCYVYCSGAPRRVIPNRRGVAVRNL